MARVHVLERAQRLEPPPARAFGFFADARNLERITPPWLNFRVATPEPIEMGEGTLIEYRLRLHGVPVKWLTRIDVWEPGVRFVDRQLRGPYSLWEHTHEFRPDGDGTLMTDRVRYSLPLGPLGGAAHALVVRRDLRRIFDYRRDVIGAEPGLAPG